MDEIGYLVKRAQHALRLQIDKSLDSINLTLPQYVALTHISKEAGLSNAELARRAFVTPQTMHRVVQGLERRGLIHRDPHPNLERVQQLFLTEDGKQSLSDSHRFVNAIETQALSHLGGEDVQILRTLLKKYIAGVEQTGD